MKNRQRDCVVMVGKLIYNKASNERKNGAPGAVGEPVFHEKGTA